VTTSPSKGSFDRLDFVDAIRGLAALYVVTFHLVFIPNPSLQLPYWISSFIQHGDTGVTLFFIASAFTLTYSMKKRESEPHTTLRFYIRRIFRILPLFYFWLILYLVRDFASYGLSHSASDILLNISFSFNFVPGKSEGIVWASWTLGIEMIFYALFPLIHKYVNDFWKSIGFLFLTIIVSMFWVQNLTHYFPNIENVYVVLSFLFRLPSFAFGIVIFYIYQLITQKKLHSPSIAFALLSISALGYYSLISGNFSNLLIDELYWEAAICSLLVLGLAVTPFPIFVNRATKFLGELSYSLYLNHPSLILYMIPVFRFFYSFPIPTTIEYLLSLLSISAVLILISTITYRIIEKPGMKLGNRIIKNSGIFSRQIGKNPVEDVA